MRALLAVAVLAVSCGARIRKPTNRGSWERLKTRISELELEGTVPNSGDIDFLLEVMLHGIEDVTDESRGEFLQEIMGYVHGKRDAKGHLPPSYTTDDPLISRLFEVEIFETLLDAAMSERN